VLEPAFCIGIGDAFGSLFQSIVECLAGASLCFSQIRFELDQQFSTGE
jgi:hypothetical protein